MFLEVQFLRPILFPYTVSFLPVRCLFNKFLDFFVKAFKCVVGSWKFTLLLLYILWDDWPIFMISSLNEQLQQQLEYTLLKPDCHGWWILKMQSEREDNLEERYAIKFCFKLRKNAKETYGMLQTAFGASCMNRASVFEWHKRFNVQVLREFKKKFLEKRPALFKSVQWHFHQDNAPVHNCILVTDYLTTKMGIKTVPHPSYSPDLGPCDFCLFSMLRGCRYETIEETKEAVTKVIDTLTQEDFHGSFQKLL